MASSSRFVKVLAFLERAFLRSAGAYGHMDKLRPRAVAYLKLLDCDPRSLRFRIAAQHLVREYDLFDEEAALLPEPLELQAKVLELAQADSTLAEATEYHYRHAPITKLFAAMLAQGANEGAGAARIRFGERMVEVFYLKEGVWKDAMTIPPSLRRPFDGMLRRADRVGYERMLPYLQGGVALASALQFAWSDDEVVIAWASSSPTAP